MWIFVVGPPICLVAAVPLVWGRGLSALDVGMAAVAYLVSGFGLTVGYHRLFTHRSHRSFKARRGLRIALAVAGSLGVEGAPVQRVANRRRHHAFADREGDPHSPWRYGTNTRALLKGLLHAHIGWMLNRELSNRARFAPDIAADPDSVCHVAGKRPFASRDKATNFWPLALLSFDESWHNSHHADPTGARHGVAPDQAESQRAKNEVVPGRTTGAGLSAIDPMRMRPHIHVVLSAVMSRWATSRALDTTLP